MSPSTPRIEAAEAHDNDIAASGTNSSFRPTAWFERLFSALFISCFASAEIKSSVNAG
jgi:hypothetical protein